VPAIPFPRAWFGAILLGFALPLHAQQPERVDLGAGRATIHNLIGTLTIEAGTGSSVVAEVSRGGKDAAQLKVMRDGGGLRVVFPGDRFVYPPLGAHSNTNLEVRDDGTFDGDRWGGGRRRVRISGTGSGPEAWADIRVPVPGGQEPMTGSGRSDRPERRWKSLPVDGEWGHPGAADEGIALDRDRIGGHHRDRA
jgi:hypothetical protein